MNDWINRRIFGFKIPTHKCDKQEWSANKSVLKKTRSRIIALMVFFILAYGCVIGRMTDLTVFHHFIAENDEETASSVAETLSTTKRADIVDSEGLLLATSLETPSLYADPKTIFNADEAARKLMTVFPDLAYDDTLKKLKSHKRFVWLKRNLTPKQVYAANALGIPGVDFLNETRRLYPQGAMMSHVIGFTDIDHKGLSGLERGEDKLLTNSDEPLQTTLDVRMQHILHREVAKSVADFNAIGGAGLIMNAKTGEISAMVSLPDFNPHDPNDAAKPENRFNRITLGAYEMGSTFKTFTSAALFEFTHTPVLTRFETTRPLHRYGFLIHDFHPEPEPLTVPEIYMKSSNIGTALEVEKIGTPTMQKFYKQLGLLDKPQIEIKEITPPLIPSPWHEINTITASYGHGIAVTPLNLATATASIINGGYKIQPTLIKRPAEYYQNESRTRVVSEDTSAKMRDMMRLVVTDGTASKANVKGYRIGGKTGTAEKTMGHGYSKHAQIASFIGAFPMDNPEYIVLIMVDEPQGNKKSYGFATAGWVAAPYVGNVIKDMAPIVGVKPKVDNRLLQIKAAMGILPVQGGRLASY
jgi:cell division protein FtsI (penicillin-binding protein 3)